MVFWWLGLYHVNACLSFLFDMNVNGSAGQCQSRKYLRWQLIASGERADVCLSSFLLHWLFLPLSSSFIFLFLYLSKSFRYFIFFFFFFCICLPSISAWSILECYAFCIIIHDAVWILDAIV